jgi:hypothetical protein
MRRQKNDMQILLIPGAIVAVAIFLFLLISANSNQPSSSEGTAPINSPAVTTPVSPTPAVVPQSEAAPVAAPAEPTAPDPKALKLLIPSEIASAHPKDNGYVVTTTFGVTWFFSQQDVESLPMSMKLRIDYGKYGAGSHGAESGN